jgi:hypothetical protein
MRSNPDHEKFPSLVERGSCDNKKEVIFRGEGPRSRRYGRTAALRLLVQPCDEDDDYYYFLSFS